MARKRGNDSALLVPEKRIKVLDGDDESSASDAGEQDFTINQEFARRFEHNEKRKELQRLEEKYGKKRTGRSKLDSDEEESDSEEGVSEDDEGEFATVDVDAEIVETLSAIRNKDPRLFDKNHKFYKDVEVSADMKGTSPKEKGMTLKEYHRKNLLEDMNGHREEQEQPRTYVQEQADAKMDLVSAMKEGAKSEDDDMDDSEDENGGFLKAKVPTKEGSQKIVLPDTSLADKDPETYLSNFFAARAWVPAQDSRFAHLDSDDSDDDNRADAFEAAYNLRFEDPDISNKTLKSHARDAVEKFSVRRDDKSRRGKAREKEQQARDEAKAEVVEEKARLRRLRVEQMEDKIKLIRKAAGGKDVDITEWVDVLEDDWDDNKFNEEMQKRFGDEYYAQEDAGSASEDERKVTKGRKKPKKPTWDNDIDIKDLVADFDSQDEAPALSDPEDDAEAEAPTKKKLKQGRANQKAQSRRDRRIIEALADQAVTLDGPKQKPGGLTFGYRETSPTNFGLSILDILAADDVDLNSWAGLKKLAPFRDSAKKEKDMRRLGKKGRLRQWRMETFGKKEVGLEDWVHEGAEGRAGNEAQNGVQDEMDVDIKEGSRKKKRKRGGKNKPAA